ncbi:MAG: ECF transporter S component, partial [Clostridia bacterium]|nr:ECF transporter S component [Clostridia bacterium]
YKLFLKMGWKKLVAVLVSLILAMILGRLVWGGVMWLIMNVNGKGFTIEQFLAGAVLNAIPGIIIQIVLVPTIMMTLDRQNNILS